MTRLAALTLALFAAPLRASDPPPIRLPEPPAVPSPMPPAPQPGAAVKLTADRLYVIDSDVPVIVLASPAGLVTVSDPEPGPVRIRGKFVDSPTDRIETRTYKGKSVVTVEAAHSGTVELIVFPEGAKTPADVIRRTVEVDAGEGPRPPPTPPTPPTPPGPKPDGASPFAESGFRVMVSFDSANTTRPAAQQSVIYGKAVHDYLDSHCVANTVGERDDAGNVMKEYRIFPANSDLRNVRAVFRDAWAKRGGADWILIGDGATGYSGPLPKTEGEALALLKKYGGP